MKDLKRIETICGEVIGKSCGKSKEMFEFQAGKIGESNIAEFFVKKTYKKLKIQQNI